MVWVSLALAGWPALKVDETSAPQDGANDAALIVGIEDYLLVPDVAGAARNASDWQDYLVNQRGVPAEATFLLLNAEANDARIRARAAEVAGRAGEAGRVWFVFVGHGAPAPDGGDGLLVGADANRDPETMVARSVPRSEILETLASGGRPVTAVLDTCFSGLDAQGEALAPELQPLVPTYTLPEVPPTVTVATAAASDQFAGPLTGEKRPAFSYLLLGAAQGWGDLDEDGAVYLGEAVRYSEGVMADHIRDRRQVPALIGDGSLLLGSGTTLPPQLEVKRASSNRRRSTGWWIAGGTLLASSVVSGSLAVVSSSQFNDTTSVDELNRKLNATRSAQAVMGVTGALGLGSLTVAVVR